MPIPKLKLLVYTLYYLKPIQIIYRGKFLLRKLFSVRVSWNVDKSTKSQMLAWENSISSSEYLNSERAFTFLNLSHSFPKWIDWNWLGYGRLWCYNLNYFEFLDHKNCTKDVGKKLIDDYIGQISSATVGMEPYPLSLRCLNWIRFIIKYKLKYKKCDAILFQQLELLTHKLEYHLLGNHLLENGIALLFGAYYFNNEIFYKRAKKILLPELKEQTLADGANFELSPMYHCTMLFRMLDCYNLVNHNSGFSRELLPVFEEKCCKMLGWLNSITFNNNDIPLFNDAAFEVAPAPEALIDYASRLGLKPEYKELGDSGYRKLVDRKFEAIVDIAKIGPDYQPGHAHADTFNFELHINNHPVIVDKGTSTYEVNQVRFYERSTAAHNTVVVDNLNSSEVWAGHRVGRRATVTIVEDSKNKKEAYHDGYASRNIKHIRSFEIKDGNFIINDKVEEKAIAYLHFHPLEHIKLENEEIIGADYCVKFEGANLIEIFDTYYAPEFNKKIPSVGVKIYFRNELSTIFK